MEQHEQIHAELTMESGMRTLASLSDHSQSEYLDAVGQDHFADPLAIPTRLVELDVVSPSQLKQV